LVTDVQLGRKVLVSVVEMSELFTSDCDGSVVPATDVDAPVVAVDAPADSEDAPSCEVGAVPVVVGVPADGFCREDAVAYGESQFALFGDKLPTAWMMQTTMSRPIPMTIAVGPAMPKPMAGAPRHHFSQYSRVG
jgi:hypothetical protein